MDIKSFWKKHFLIISIIAVALAMRIVLLFDYYSIWWDDAVYLSMGKYLFSWGHAGFYEHIRPIFVPVFLGLFWALAGVKSAIILGRIFEIILSIGSIIVVYLICRRVFDEKIALLSSILLAFSSITLFMNYHLYTEIPAAFFILLALYLLLCRKYFFSGITLGVALICKFPALIIFVAIILFMSVEYLLFRKKEKLLAALFVLLGFISLFLLYLVFNQIVVGNPISPLTDASAVIGQVAGCNYLHTTSWNYYLDVLFKENLLHIFAIVGLVSVMLYRRKEKNHNKMLIVSLLVISLLYYSAMNCREYRYLIMFVPLVCMLSGYGVAICLNKMYLSKSYFFTILAVVLIVSGVYGLTYYQKHHDDKHTWVDLEYHEYLANKNFTGEVLIGNPILSAYTDKSVIPLYYPVWNSDLAAARLDYIKENSSKISAVVFDSCEGGMECIPTDPRCAEKTAELIVYLNRTFILDYQKEAGRCIFYAYVER